MFIDVERNKATKLRRSATGERRVGEWQVDRFAPSELRALNEFMAINIALLRSARGAYSGI